MDNLNGFFFVDPLQTLFECVLKRWPDLNVRVQFVDEESGLLSEGCLGATSFPGEGEVGPIIISLSADLEGIQGILSIAAHELAHAVTGVTCEGGDGHSEEWEKNYDLINEDFCNCENISLRQITVEK